MVSLLAESWTWWSVVFFVAISRFISRRMTQGGFRRFQADDYCMLLVLAFYTTLIATINIVRFTNSNLLPPGYDVSLLTPEEIRERSYGSKLILVVEQCQCTTIWGAKACLLILYLRLTTLRRENIAIKILAAYVAISFAVMEILYFGVWCRPFWEYWAVPTNSIQCDAATNHLITNAVFNLTSDCIMLAIGLPMFLRLHLPWKKKVPLILIFSLGIFVVLAAILNKVYSFTEPFGSAWTYWYVRESSTALLVANLPFVWTVWRLIPGVSSVSQQSKHPTSQHDQQFQLSDHGKNKTGPPDHETDWHSTEAGVYHEAENEHDRPHSKHGRVMSLDEMLGETEPRNHDVDATIITHPWLFAQRRKNDLPLSGDPPACRDQDMPIASQDDPSEEAREPLSTVTSTLPSIDSSKSATSFL